MVKFKALDLEGKVVVGTSVMTIEDINEVTRVMLSGVTLIEEYVMGADYKNYKTYVSDAEDCVEVKAETVEVIVE